MDTELIIVEKGMLGFFSSKTKVVVGSLCEVQHPVSSLWMPGSVTKDEGDGYFSVLIDGSDELLNHVLSKKLRKIRAPDRIISESEKSVSISASTKSAAPSVASTKSENRRTSFSFFGNSSKAATERAVTPAEPVKEEPILENPPSVKMARKSSIKALVDPPDDVFTKKIQRRKLENAELQWLERTRKSKENNYRSLDLSKLDLEETLPEIFCAEPYLSVPELILRKNLMTALSPIAVFHSLVKLDLSHNIFFEAGNLRECFAPLLQLTTLRHLDISGNNLDNIPVEVYTLAKLETFIARRNEIRDVPSALSACLNLVTVDLSYNQIATIPSIFEELKMLSELNLDHNPCLLEGVESLQQSNAGEKTIFLLEKRTVYRSRQFRRNVVSHASSIQKAVLEKEKNRILAQQDVHFDEGD